MSYPIPLMLGLALGLLAEGSAFAAPGEDPIVLTTPVSYLQLPMNNAKSAAPDNAGGLPSNVKAKIVRLEAKAYSDSSEGISTDADVRTTVTGNGQQKSCVQDVGSNTTTNGAQRFGPGNKQQIVVLRGDLVNICK